MSRWHPPLEEAYFTWLCSFVGSVLSRDRRHTHVKLLRILHKTPFVYFVPNDENRAMDGCYLREEFLAGSPEYAADVDWMTLECSFLEMLIALAHVADFETDPGVVPDGVKGWFWIFLENLKVHDYTDAAFLDGDAAFIEEDISNILNTVNMRTYSRNGEGGLFPLNHARKDQRKNEIWHQLSAYLLENRYVRL